jgi:hypothetical protein
MAMSRLAREKVMMREPGFVCCRGFHIFNTKKKGTESLRGRRAPWSREGIGPVSRGYNIGIKGVSYWYNTGA